ncbi:MAG: 2-C-methyl-D-erythritol 4-phosphate cytidylyltransferase [Candidatus Omnitrophica bacterium]|nr:2-C-methyl-D-erythritol 4-phosphate cytidylyltransferase [Candidatus Omnitrophota bacterium]
MISDTGSVAAIVPAAGAGRRVGGPGSKLFVALRGRPLLAHALRALQASACVRWIVPVVRAAERARVQALIARYGITKAVAPCLGGPSRAESVARGLAALPAAARWVLIHDGARPCLSPRLVDAAVRAARRQGAVACGLPAALTVKAVDARGEVRLTLDREHLWLVQTPQVFRRDWLTEAFARADGRLERFPDDAAVVESAGYAVRMIPGDPLNLKVTTKDDLLFAEAVLASANGRGMR